jgi:hypothetical protein
MILTIIKSLVYGIILYIFITGNNWIFLAIVINVILILENLFSRWCRLTKVVPLTSEESLGVLIALLRIRSAEIGAMYNSIRTYQEEAKDNSWIPLFIAEYRNFSNYNIYQESCDRREQKYRNKAYALYTKRFSYNPFYGLLDESELTDTSVAMLYWTSGLDKTIRLLKSISCDANLSRHVCALLKEYQLIRFLTLGGNYHILFKNWRPLSSLVRERYRLLCQQWEEVWHSHQNSILIAQAEGHLKQGSYLLEDLWSEGLTLANMERNLGRAFSQKNIRDISLEGTDEQVFFEHLKTNPIWAKTYGDESYSSYDSNRNESPKEEN